MFIKNAIKIAVLVIIGMVFLLNIPNLYKFLKGEYKTMNTKKIGGKIMKWIGGFVSLLGLAFLGGSYLAYIQGFFTQIYALAMAGIICLLAGIVLLVKGALKGRKSE
jgi:hypothetical protein